MKETLKFHLFFSVLAAAAIVLLGATVCAQGLGEGTLPLPPKINERQEPHSVIARAGFDRTGHYSTQDINWQGKVVWDQDTEGSIGFSHALFFNRKVYYVDSLGLRVYSADDGQHLWTWSPREKIGQYSYASIDPLIHKGVVYLPLLSSKDYTALVALDAEDGRILWRYDSGVPGGTISPVLYKDDIIFGRGSFVISIDVETRKERWRFNALESIWTLTLFKDTLIFGTNKLSTGMYAIDASNGKKKWNGSKNGVSLYYVPVSAGRMFIGTLTGVNAVDMETGGLVWFQNGLSDTTGELAIDNDTIYGGSLNGLFALDKATGAIRWVNKALIGTGPPSIAGNALYVVHDKITAVNKKTGRVIGSVKGLGFYTSYESITIYANRIFVPGGKPSDFKLYCIE
jgi:outer membrane protein assembly factor BamB